MTTDRYWDSEQARWVYPTELTAIADAFRAAANDHRWIRPEHRHVREWLWARAGQIENGGAA